ncbi:hypothetical protein DVH05_009612 [Phytophthora capsici]|nr:hypothetical protein DVH05_009612 [Phytophthora capsici]
MLHRLLELKPAIELFFLHLLKPEEKKEFPRLRLKRTSASGWLTIECLMALLAATRSLGGQDYPTLALAYPFFRMIWRELERPDIFNEAVALANVPELAAEVLGPMNRVRGAFKKLFQKRFGGLNDEMMWISCLDSRFAKMPHLTQDEKAITNVARSEQIPRAAEQSPNPIFMSPPKKGEDRLFQSVFGANMTSDDDVNATAQAHLNISAACESELALYLSLIVAIKPTQKPLQWWKANAPAFPTISRLARK